MNNPWNDYLIDSSGLYPLLPIKGKDKIWYFSRMLTNLIKAQFEIEHVPEHWNYDYLMKTLVVDGYVAIADLPKYGVVPQKCGLKGYDLSMCPDTVIINNPHLRQTWEGRIGKDCALIKLLPDYLGHRDTIAFYASRMALASESADMSVFNSKVAFIMAAKNQKIAASLDKMFDQIQQGKPKAVVDGQVDLDSIKLLLANPKNAFIAPELLQSQNDLLAQFKDTIGIFHQNNEKKANLLNSEVQNSQAQVSNQLKMCVDCVNRGFDVANRLFGLQLHMKAAIDPAMIGLQEVGAPNEDMGN